MAKEINNVPQKNADTKEEKLLLGFLNQEAERLNFGTITVEFKIRDGKVYSVESHQQSRQFIVLSKNA